MQRAMVHLMFGEIENARELVDRVDIERHKDAKSRATVAALAPAPSILSISASDTPAAFAASGTFTPCPIGLPNFMPAAFRALNALFVRSLIMSRSVSAAYPSTDTMSAESFDASTICPSHTMSRAPFSITFDMIPFSSIIDRASLDSSVTMSVSPERIPSMTEYTSRYAFRLDIVSTTTRASASP